MKMKNTKAADILEILDKSYITLTPEERQAIAMAVSALRRVGDGQRYIVHGINNDKIEFVTNLDLRAFNRYVQSMRYQIDRLSSCQPTGSWTPVSSLGEIPKNGAYWIAKTYFWGDSSVERIYWDVDDQSWKNMTGWNIDSSKYITAYMPYTCPEPYKTEETTDDSNP